MGRGSPGKLVPPRRLLEDSYNEALTLPERDPDCRETGLYLPGLEKTFGKAKQHHRGGAARCPSQESGRPEVTSSLFSCLFQALRPLWGANRRVQVRRALDRRHPGEAAATTLALPSCCCMSGGTQSSLPHL